MTVHNPQGGVAASSSSDGTRNELAAYSSDYGCVPDSSSDQTDQLQAWADAVRNRVGGKRVGILEPGSYRKEGTLNITSASGYPISFRGFGGIGDEQSPSVIIQTADAGEDTYAIAKENPYLWEINGISLIAEGPDLTYDGTPMWDMAGIQVNGRGILRNGTVAGGFFAGIGLIGDHLKVYDMIIGSNYYNIWLPPGQGSQGEIILNGVQANEHNKAGIAISGDCVLGGFKMTDGSIGQGPTGILRYDDGGGALGSSFGFGWRFDSVATEFCGRAICFDEKNDGAGILSIEWLGSRGDDGLYNDDRWDGESREGAWVIGGAIGEFYIEKGFPTATTTRPAFKASAIRGVYAPRSGEYVLQAIVDGARLFETDAGAQNVIQNVVGTSAGPASSLLVPFMIGTGTVSRGMCLTNYQELGAQKYAGSGHVIGVAALHGSSADEVNHAILRGNDSTIKVLNTSGGELTNGTMVKPHSDGGVQAATGAAGEQVIGRLTQTIADDALGTAELFGMS